MVLEIEQPLFHGLLMVISGGQCGADRGGLEAAYQMGIITGGIAPRGWRTARGPAPELAKLGLLEDDSSGYDSRTRKNVEASDATLIVASNPASAGTALTINYCRRMNKPFKVVNVYNYTNDFLLGKAVEVSDWISDNRASVLNVAGNRDPFGSLFHHEAASKLVNWVLLDLYRKGELVIKEI